MFLDWPISQTDKDALVEAATEAIDDSLAAANGSGLQDYVLFYCWIPAEIWALLLSTTVGRMKKLQIVMDVVIKLGGTRPTDHIPNDGLYFYDFVSGAGREQKAKVAKRDSRKQSGCKIFKAIFQKAKRRN